MICDHYLTQYNVCKIYNCYLIISEHRLFEMCKMDKIYMVGEKHPLTDQHT